MKRFIGIILPIFMLTLALSTASCKKDKDEVVIPLIDYVLNEYNYGEFPTKSEGYDSVAFKYDANKRLIKMVSEYDETTFTYDAAGRVIRIDVPQYGKISNSGSYILLTWEGSKVTMQHYWGEGNTGYYRMVITFNNKDEIILIEYLYNWQPRKEDVDNWVKEGYSEMTWSNGNITKFSEYWMPYYKKSETEKGENYSFKGAGWLFLEEAPREPAKEEIDYELRAEALMTYDNKLNPFVIYPGLGLLYGNEMFYMFLPKNNVIKMDITEYWYQETYSWEANMTILYNNKNFPVKITSVETDEGEDWFDEMIWTIVYLEE